MSRTFLVSTSRADLEALHFQGISVSESHAQIQSSLENSLSPEHARLLAEPVPHSSGAAIDWYTPLQGPVSRLDALPVDEQRAAAATVERLAADIAKLAGTLQAEGAGPKFVRGNVLSLALRYPGIEAVYVVGGTPVITGWGCSSPSAGSEPQDLLRLGGVIAAAPAQQTIQETAAPLPPPPPQRSGFLGPVLAFLGGIALLVGLYFLAALLLTPAGCALPRPPLPAGCATNATGPAPPPVQNGTAAKDGTAASPELVSSLTAEREKERSLRDQLESLRAQLSKRRADCLTVSPEPPPPDKREETPPEPEPFSMAEVMPTTPDPLEPEPAPEPEKKRKMGEDMVIPEGARENNDLSFLEGCWRNETKLYDTKRGKPLRTTYCFDENGYGTRTIKGDGYTMTCRGPMRASFDKSGRLIFRLSQAKCDIAFGPFGTQTFRCKEGKSGVALCDDISDHLFQGARFRRVK